MVFGRSVTNTVANSVLLGNSSLVNVRPANDNLADLGTVSNRFKDIHYAGTIVGLNAVRSLFSLFPSATVAVTDTVTPSTVLGPGLGSLTVPANTTQGGTLLQIVGASRLDILDL
jgi:hypothetical protein